MSLPTQMEYCVKVLWNLKNVYWSISVGFCCKLDFEHTQILSLELVHLLKWTVMWSLMVTKHQLVDCSRYKLELDETYILLLEKLSLLKCLFCATKEQLLTRISCKLDLKNTIFYYLLVDRPLCERFIGFQQDLVDQM